MSFRLVFVMDMISCTACDNLLCWHLVGFAEHQHLIALTKSRINEYTPSSIYQGHFRLTVSNNLDLGHSYGPIWILGEIYGSLVLNCRVENGYPITFVLNCRVTYIRLFEASTFLRGK